MMRSDRTTKSIYRNASFLFCSLLLPALQLAQGDTIAPGVTLTGYTEIYYSYDLSNPDDHLRPGFFYSFNRHNEVNLNLGYMKIGFDKDGVRANLALMAGTYSQYNLSAEHPVFQHVLEANAGVKLSKKQKLWLDAGIFSSHIGFESATGKLCYNLTRSILAENSPYYESGMKLGYSTQNDKFYAALLLLNGWQHIQRVPGCNTPSGGSQIVITPNDKFLFNWSTFVGNEFPDSVQKWRYFNDFFAQIRPHKKLVFIAGFDIGYQQKEKGSSSYSMWYAPVLVAKFSASSKLDIGARGEFYCDPDGVIIATGTPNGFQTYGYSLNFDYHIKPHYTWRVEGRGLSSLDPIFLTKRYFTSENYFLTTSLAIEF